MKRKLYIDYRVYFDPQTDQTLLRSCAKAVQERIYDMFDGLDEECSGPTPAPSDVTFEITMEVDMEKDS